MMRSYFLEADDVDRLDIIFPSKNLVKNVISVDFVIFNNTSNL